MFSYKKKPDNKDHCVACGAEVKKGQNNYNVATTAGQLYIYCTKKCQDTFYKLVETERK